MQGGILQKQENFLMNFMMLLMIQMFFRNIFDILWKKEVQMLIK
jgi:hypothetical protein